MHCLLNAYPETGLELIKTIDYWEARRLLEIKSQSSKPPNAKIQEARNLLFNEFLDSVANKKLKWLGVKDLHTIKTIKDKSFNHNFMS